MENVCARSVKRNEGNKILNLRWDSSKSHSKSICLSFKISVIRWEIQKELATRFDPCPYWISRSTGSVASYLGINCNEFIIEYGTFVAHVCVIRFVRLIIEPNLSSESMWKSQRNWHQASCFDFWRAGK